MSQNEIKATEFMKEAEKYDPDLPEHIGIEKNIMTAMEFYKKAGEYGNAEAFFCLGVIYNPFSKEYTNVEKEASKAIEFYEKSANLGSAKSMFVLGLIFDPDVCHGDSETYKNQYSGIKNWAKAKEFYKKASNCGHSRAGLNLAVSYDPTCAFQGEKNIGLATEEYIKNIKNGCKESTRYLEKLYHSKYCDHIDYKEKIKFFAENNLRDGLNKLLLKHKDKIMSDLLSIDELNKKIKELSDKNEELNIQIQYMPPPKGGMGYTESENDFYKTSNL